MRKRGIFKSTNSLDNHASIDHIGERRELLEDGTCEIALMVPNSNRTYCTLPGRIDVAKHHILHGGPTSKKQYKDSYKKIRVKNKVIFSIPGSIL